MKDHIRVFYCCPLCKTKTGEMKIAEDKIYHMNEEDIASRPDLAAIIGYEVLICPCGQELSWFTVEEVNE